MILSKNDIRQAVEAREIEFTPELEPTQWGEASVDLRLGFQFTKFKATPGLTISVADGLRTIGSLGLWVTKDTKGTR
jgi:deoxycytidine triphosphate deaminase